MFGEIQVENDTLIAITFVIVGTADVSNKSLMIPYQLIQSIVIPSYPNMYFVMVPELDGINGLTMV